MLIKFVSDPNVFHEVWTYDERCVERLFEPLIKRGLNHPYTTQPKGFHKGIGFFFFLNYSCSKHRIIQDASEKLDFNSNVPL